jgi:hypothetical protein
MRRNRLLILTLGVALAVIVASVASAKFETYRVGNLILKLDGQISPKKLPRKAYAPVTFNVRGKISTADGSHPPAFRELVLETDKNGKLNTKGLAVCKDSLEARTTKSAKQVCGKSIVGSGSGRVQIAFPEQPPIPVKSPITVFNAGTKGGKTTLLIHAYITVPVPSAIVTTVTVKKIHKGRYGMSTVAKIPVIVGGSGSVLEFSITFGKTFTYKGKRQAYLLARCPDGHLNAHIVKALFRNEAGGPRTTVEVKDQTIIRACTPKG